MDMEEETRRELSSLQRERELLQAKEKSNLDAIDEVRGVVFQNQQLLYGVKWVRGAGRRSRPKGYWLVSYGAVLEFFTQDGFSEKDKIDHSGL